MGGRVLCEFQSLLLCFVLGDRRKLGREGVVRTKDLGGYDVARERRSVENRREGKETARG